MCVIKLVYLNIKLHVVACLEEARGKKGLLHQIIFISFQNYKISPLAIVILPCLQVLIVCKC